MAHSYGHCLLPVHCLFCSMDTGWKQTGSDREDVHFDLLCYIDTIGHQVPTVHLWAQLDSLIL